MLQSFPMSIASIHNERRAGELGVVLLASLYPSRFRPVRAPFNRQQFAELAGLCRLGQVSPVPWVQALSPPAGWKKPFEPNHPVSRPIFWYPPLLGRAYHGACMLASSWPWIKSMASRIKPDVLLANWLYPDGWAGMMAARRLGVPYVLQVLGSDLKVIAKDPSRRGQILEALNRAGGIMTKSVPLRDELVAMGIAREKTMVVPNGVDQGLFHPRSQTEARQRLGLPEQGQLALFVGNLVEVKNPSAAIRAMFRLPGVDLLLAGGGPLEQSLKILAQGLGVASRVRFLGPVDHRHIAELMTASDCLVLPSLSEGEPNAVLEALASGRPVAASRVGGVPYLVREGENGSLAEPGDVEGMAAALGRVLSRDWSPESVAATVAGRSWRKSASELMELLQRAADGRP